MDVIIPGYTIKRVLGKGGMATVYLAVQDIFERDVALKVMNARLAEAPSFGQRFMREAKIVSRLVHPNIITVFDVGVHDDLYFLSMEYVDGPDLKTGHEQLTIAQKLTVVRDLATALAYAHEKGIVHRDIKAENILLRTPGNQPVLMDFGIARAAETELSVTQTGTSLGTPHYMSPEQARGTQVDHRSDLYSLGVVLYYALMGVVPYRGDSAVSVGIKHITEPLPQLPRGLGPLQFLIDRLMAKDPADRYQSAHELILDIDALDLDQVHALVNKYGVDGPERATARSGSASRMSREAREVRESREAPTIIQANASEHMRTARAGRKKASPLAVKRKRWALASLLSLSLFGSGAVVIGAVNLIGTDANAPSNTLEATTNPEEVLASGAASSSVEQSFSIEQQLDSIRDRLNRLPEKLVLGDAEVLESTATQLRRQLDQRGMSATEREALLEFSDQAALHILAMLDRGQYSQAENLYTHYLWLLPELANVNNPLTAELAPLINKLPEMRLWRENAKAAYAAGNYVQPEDSSALYYYLRLQHLHPKFTSPLYSIKKMQRTLRKKAQALYDDGYWGKAYPYAKNMLVIDPQDRWALATKTTIEDYQKEENNVNDWLVTAKELLASGQYFSPRKQNAFAYVAEVLDARPDNRDAQQLLAEIEHQFAEKLSRMLGEGEVENALKEVQSAINSVGPRKLLVEWQDNLDGFISDQRVKAQRGPQVQAIQVSDEPINSVRSRQKRTLNASKSLYGAISYSGFNRENQVLYAVLESTSGQRYDQVPIVISNEVGETRFRIDRAMRPFQRGSYQLKLLFNEQIIAQTNFKIDSI